MDEKQKRGVLYWLESAEGDWDVANHLFEKGDYSYSLFFGHLTIEKILKAI
jgi:HEPN domain-containing protein